MPHPIMFGEEDPGLAQVREIALSFPGAFEKISWGRPVFCAPKMFVMYGGNAKLDGAMVPFPYSLLVKIEEDERLPLEQDDRFFYPAYLGPFGWLGLDLTATATGDVDWIEVRELVDASFRLIAPKRSVRELDSRSG